VIARFDDMATPYAALVWGLVLPLETLDTTQILEFWQLKGERTNPEPQCQATPSSPAPSAEPSAESSVAPSAQASPATNPEASPEASPS
jgi:hypothetical protein